VSEAPEHAAAAQVLDRAKQLWDRVAIAAGLAYALGYASRALHAYDFNFGALPGARFEYLVAGCVLFLPIAGLAVLGWGLYRLGAALKAWSQRDAARAQALQARLLGPLLTLCVLGLVLNQALPASWSVPGLARVMGPVIVVLVFLSAVLGAHRERRAHASPTRKGAWRQVAHGVTVFWRWVMALYFGLLLLLIFLIATFAGALVLRYVPQEFGGVAAKCAILDLAADQLSPELAALLIEPALAPTQAAVLRSQRVAVFSTAGPWLVRVPDPAASAAMRRSLRLSEQAVRSVEWVGRATPTGASGRGCPEEP